MTMLNDSIRIIDDVTKGFCVFPQGMNENCTDCTQCRQTFLKRIEKVMERGGSARLLIIDNGELKDDKEL